jgi:ketosteroid isomerase-like protein
MKQQIDELFKAIDGKDAGKFAAHLATDCVFRFGNLPSIEGRANAEQFVAAFFDSIASLSHTIMELWELPEGVICHGQVTYTRKNQTTLTVPFANVLKGNGEGISEYLIFADTSELYSI